MKFDPTKMPGQMTVAQMIALQDAENVKLANRLTTTTKDDQEPKQLTAAQVVARRLKEQK